MKIKLSSILMFVFASAVMGSGVGYSSLYLFHIALIVFLIVFFYSYFVNGSQYTLFWPKNNYLFFLYLTFVWYAVGIVWSIDILYSLRYLFYLSIGIILVFLVTAYANTRDRYVLVFKVLVLFFCLSIVVALLESFTAFRLPTSPYSSFSQFLGRGSTDLYDSDILVHKRLMSTPTSFWGNPNNLAVSMTIVAPFFMFHGKKTVRFLGLLAVMIVVIASGSRGAFIAIVFGFFLFLIVRSVSYAIPVAAFFFIAFSFFPQNIDALKSSDNERIAELAWTGNQLYAYLFDDVTSMNSIGARQQLIRNGLDALWDTGGLGVGGGGSQAVQEELGGVAGRLTSMHNFWVEILVEAGVFFFIAFMIWYFSLSYVLYRVYKKTADNFYRYQAGSLLVAMITFLVSAISASSVIYFLPMWLMFGMVLSIYNIYRKESL